MKNSFSIRIPNSFIVLLCLLEAISVTAQGRWEALGSPTGSAIDKMISTSDNKLFIFMQYSGIQYSDDLGEHWVSKNEGLEEIQGFTRMVAGPDGSVFLANGDKLYKLKNVHSDWELMNYSGGKIDGLYLGKNNRFFCISGQKVFISYDVGLSFIKFFETSSQYGSIVEFSYNGNNQNYVVCYQNSRSVVFKFDDQLKYFQTKFNFLSQNGPISSLVWHSDGKLFFTGYPTAFLYDELSNTTTPIIIDQNTGNTLRGFLIKDSYNNLVNLADTSYLSVDGGENWSLLNQQIWKEGYLNLAVFIDSFLFVSSQYCTKPSLNRYFNFGSSLTELANTLTQPTVYSFISDTSNQLIVATCESHYKIYPNYKQSKDQGNSWSNFQIFGDSVSILKKSNSNHYFAIRNDTTYISIDHCQTWVPWIYDDFTPSYDLFISPDNDLYYSKPGSTFLRAKEDGSELNYLTLPRKNGSIINMLFHPNGRIYIHHINNLYYSDDKGENFIENLNIGLYSNTNYSYDMSLLGDIYLVKDGLFFIDPELANMNLIEPVSTESRLIGHDNSNNVFVYEAKRGLLQCNKAGCQPFDMTGFPLPFMFIRSIYQDENNYLYAGLYNDKIYKYSLPIVSTKHSNENDSETFRVFPNPFSSNLNVEVLNSKTGGYPVLVHDVFGRTVHESFEKNSVFKIETESMPSGVYLIRVGDSGFRKIIKI